MRVIEADAKRSQTGTCPPRHLLHVVERCALLRQRGC